MSAGIIAGVYLNNKMITDRQIQKQQFEQVTEQKKNADRQKLITDCENVASYDALRLLKSKVSDMESNGLTSLPEYPIYARFVEVGSFLKEDYAFYYDACLTKYGLK